MSLIERSKAFTASATDLDGLRQAALLVTAVSSRAVQFENALAKLRVAAGQLRLLREQGVSVVADIGTAAGFSHHLNTLRAALSTDPSAATVSEVNVRTLSPLAAFTSNLASACQSAWGAHVAKRLPGVRNDVLQVLGRVPPLKPRVDQFRALLTQAQSRAASVPSSAHEVSVFEQTATACHAAWAALDANEIPAGVLVFIQQTTSGGASLDRLTDEVIAWLAEHQLKDSFVIQAR
jgi:hypothetical protein